nr:MAG TPA: zinc-ribbon domain protein [Caudoviricetes sp.]
MYCKNCGEQIPENSKFCLNCGAVVSTYEPEPTDSPTTSEQMVEPEKQKENKGCGRILVLFGVCVILFAIVIQGMGESAGTSSSTPALPAVASTVESVQSGPPLSPRQQQIRSAFENGAQWDIEDTIKRLLKNPDTAKFTHNKGSWSADNAILTGDGSVNYTNASGKSVTETFTVSVITTDEHYFPLFVKLGDSVSVDDRKGVNSLGLTTKTGESIFGTEQSHSIFGDDAANLVVVTDEFRQNITLAEFNRIEAGMRYEEVTEIIGSFGAEQARSEIAGYQSVIIAWDGNGSVGANANVTFSNGQVIAKAQIGLQ